MGDRTQRVKGKINEVTGKTKRAAGYQRGDTATEAKGDAQKFSLLLTEYRKAPEITRRRLYLEAMQAILPSLQKKVIVDDSLKSILQTLPLLPSEPAKPQH